MKTFALVCLVSASSLFANMGPQGFSEFLNICFIETGTFGGDSVQKALDAGFSFVRSIEYNETLVKDARNRFRGNKRVSIYEGDSSIDLWNMIEDIDQPVTFWLDAHICPARESGDNCPLIEELEQIKRHPVKTHTILIDDMHCCNTVLFDYLSQQDLIDKILEINPTYQISYRAGGDAGEYPNNVMVATCPSR